MAGWIDTSTDPYELAGIPRREAKVQQFFTAYDHWNPEVSDGSELQEMEHLLGITPEEWAARRESFTVQF